MNKSSFLIKFASFKTFLLFTSLYHNSYMQVSVFRKAHFNSAHRLHNPALSDERNVELFGLCNNPSFHGHNYMLEVRVKGDVNPETGYVMDTKILKEVIKTEVQDKYDHRNLNLDTEDFRNLNPTAENIAIVIWHSLRRRIDQKLELSLRLYETENNYVEFDGK
jgi:6-pyruvoyltetrahydropterin/6-carboxytetrahydropterin synthase